MYLVELRPGKEELYRSGDELASAIRRGDVDVHSRIYHRATSKWISVTLHPQFKAIIAERSAEPLPALERSSWTYLNAQSETLEVNDPEPDAGDGGSGEAPGLRAHPWRRMFGLGVTGVALVLGAQLAFSGPRPPWAGSAEAEVPARPAGRIDPAAGQRAQVISLAGSSGAWESDEGVHDPVVDLPAPADPAPTALPRAPSLKLKALNDVLPSTAPAATADANTIDGLLNGYAEAYGTARDRLGSGIRVARLNQLFAPTRLTPDGGVTDVRLGLAGAANFIRVYRQQESEIEREYQDSFAALSKEHGWSSRVVRRWYGRSAQKEPTALVQLTTQLIASLDTLLGVLDDEAGAYRLGEGTIAFEDPGASRRYSELRIQIAGLLDSARAAGGEESGGPMGLLLQAVGTTRLPREI
ncbi:MAG TPA: hypothetical protein VMN37_05995 [Gemmatimonadales bacterium]|nr:hypothetical protein [Gemmatimonadales bacterium]